MIYRLDIENEMEEATIDHKVKCEFLESKIEESQKEYESLLKKHMDIENDLRSKRYRQNVLLYCHLCRCYKIIVMLYFIRIEVEKELRSWLEKYDDVVGEKQTYFDEITKCYEDEKAELENLQVYDY